MVDAQGRGALETRGRKAGGVPKEQVQARSLEFFAQGMSVAQVCAKVDRSRQTYELWRATTEGYAEKVDRIRAKLKGAAQTVEISDFISFRKKYLGVDTFWHQRQWIDLLEGREPQDFHESQIYRPGGPRKDRILINTPPNHGKSTTITHDYVAYRICKDPTIRVIILSASKRSADKFLRAVKNRLSHPKYDALIRDFGPGPQGFRDENSPWTQDMFYVAGADPAEKDPTVQSLGLGGQIYGARADLIIMDDVITLKTARQKNHRQNTIDYMRTEALSRLEPGTGRLLVVGTRLSFDDLYGEIIRQDEAGVWTYLTQPMILEYGETPAQHHTLWPERFDGLQAHGIMADHGHDMARFRLVYQQEAAPEDAVFPADAVEGCCVAVNPGLNSCSMRQDGMNGLYVVGGVDLAASGFTAFVILGVDKRTKMRYLIDCLNIRAMKPHILRAKMIEWTKLYRVNEWRVEKNGLQTLLSQDAVLRAELLGNSSRLVEHHTVEYGHTGKWDPDFGVATLAPLFLGALESPKANLITIPNNHTHRAIRELIDQLVSWEPATVGKTDLVMALWFADLGARKQLIVGQQQHMPNRWATKGQLASRVVLRIQDYLDKSA